MTIIPFEEVRKGDTVQVSYLWGEVEFSRTGVVHNQDGSDWRTSDGTWLNMDVNSPVSIKLLNRPEPKLPDEGGSLILAKKVRGTEGEFVLFLKDNGSWYSAVAIEDDFYGGSYYWHPAQDIKDWVEMALVPKEE